MALLLKDCPVEYKLAQDDSNCLLAELQVVVPKEWAAAMVEQVNGKIAADQAQAATLAYALEHETG